VTKVTDLLDKAGTGWSFLSKDQFSRTSSFVVLRRRRTRKRLHEDQNPLRGSTSLCDAL